MKDILPLVTIISGYFNRATLVQRSLESLISQDYGNLEIIVFDDASTDNTYEELKRFENIDDRVKIIRHAKNIGFVNGLINAVNAAKGEYIAIHGSGDISYPQRVSKQVEVLKKSDKISVVSCYYQSVDSGGKSIIVKKPNQQNFYKTLQKQVPIIHGAAMFKRRYYDLVGGYRPFFKYAQDTDLWARLSLVSEYFVVEEVLYERRFDDKDGVASNPIKNAKQGIYGDMIMQSIRLRKERSFDLIDTLQLEALAFRKKRLSTSKRIAGLAIRVYMTGDIDQFNILCEMLKFEKFCYTKALVFLVKNRIIKKSVLLRILSFRKKSLSLQGKR